MSKQLSEARKLEARIIKRLTRGDLGAARERDERVRFSRLREEIARLANMPTREQRVEKAKAQQAANEAYEAWAASAEDPRIVCPHCSLGANWYPATAASGGFCRGCWYADPSPLAGGDQSLEIEWVRLQSTIPE